MTKINYKHKIEDYTSVRLLKTVHIKLRIRSIKEKLNMSETVDKLEKNKNCDEVLLKIISKIEKLKEKVEKQTGSFKYSNQYDDCIAIIKLEIVDKLLKLK